MLPTTTIALMSACASTSQFPTWRMWAKASCTDTSAGNVMRSRHAKVEGNRGLHSKKRCIWRTKYLQALLMCFLGSPSSGRGLLSGVRDKLVNAMATLTPAMSTPATIPDQPAPPSPMVCAQPMRRL